MVLKAINAFSLEQTIKAFNTFNFFIVIFKGMEFWFDFVLDQKGKGDRWNKRNIHVSTTHKQKENQRKRKYNKAELFKVSRLDWDLY